VRSEPGASLPLGLGDFARRHLDGDFGPALLATRAARQSRKVEPFVRFDEIDRHAPAARRIDNAKLEQGIDIAALCVRKAAADKEFRAFLADCAHLNSPPGTRRHSGADGK
jgi:hypothetical protein